MPAMAEARSNPVGIRNRSAPVLLDVLCAARQTSICCELSPEGGLVAETIESAEQQWRTGPDGDFVTRGLIDLQVNGFGGLDFNRGGITADRLDLALIELAKTGVTAFLPAIITGSAGRMVRVLRELDEAVAASRLGPLMIAGYHIEGPFLSPEDGFSGSHDSAHMSAANLDLIDDLQRNVSRGIKLVTIAPEVSGAIEMIRVLAGRGIQVAIGHSNANEQQISAAVDAGVTLCTHLGNGLPQMLHKTDNPIFWQLADDRLTAMFIADGIHVPRPALQTMLRAKGHTRTILTTDAVSAAGINTGPGFYTLGAAEIERSQEGSVRIPGSSYLAGSSVTMDQMLRNMMAWYGLTVPVLVQLMRENPLHFIRTRQDPGPMGATDGVVEWETTADGPVVRRAHIGPFTVE